jgi:hypothetical protein
MVALTITVNDGHGHIRTTQLACNHDSASAPGLPAGQARALCVAARQLASFLASQPRADRLCSQIYGGPQTARIAGAIGDLHVDRHFSRTDGCEISDWERAAALLGEPRAPHQAAGG